MKIKLDSLTVGYNGVPLIADITLSLAKGEILTLIGPNGAGKSTILKSITRHLATISGTVYLDGKNMQLIKGSDVAKQLAVVLTERIRPELMTFCGVDATNYESLAAALKNFDEPLCISTEGMMMYFTENEADTVVANVRSLLEVHGGCWITPDPEFKLQFILTFRSVFGENFLEKLTATGNAAMKQSNVGNLSNSFIVDERADSLKTTENFLAKHGLKAERINLAEHMPELSVYRQLTSKQILQFKEAMRRCHYWLITLDDARKPQALKKQTPFEMSCTVENGILRMTLRGRVDSLSAPKILTAWEAEKLSNVIDGVEIDCAELEFISSAGVRVLSDMNEDCKRGVKFFNAKPSLSQINCL